MRIGVTVASLVLFVGAPAAAYWVNVKGNPFPQFQIALPQFLTKQTASQPPQGKGGSGRRNQQQDGPAPVTVASVTKQTVPVYREGIGNVQALNAVTVRSQVDGRLLSVEFTEGQEVRKGTVLARIDPVTYKAQYDQAVAKKAQDEANLANARIDLERYRRLAATNAGPKQQADQQAAQVAQLEAQIKSDQAAIDNSKAILDYTTILAPIDGRAGLRQIDPGNIVRASDANGLVSIAQVKPIGVLFTLPQRDLDVTATALAKGPVMVEIPGPERKGAASIGTLQSIDNQVDVSTGTIKIKASFPNADQKLWPGQFVNIRVVVDTLVDAKVVPASAIRRGVSGNFVYVVGEDRKAVVRPVDVTQQSEEVAVVAKGVEFGQSVVTQGFARLTDGKVVSLGDETDVDDAAPKAADRNKGDGKGPWRGAAKRDGAPKGQGAKNGDPAAPAAAVGDGNAPVVPVAVPAEPGQRGTGGKRERRKRDDGSTPALKLAEPGEAPPATEAKGARP